VGSQEIRCCFGSPRAIVSQRALARKSRTSRQPARPSPGGGGSQRLRPSFVFQGSRDQNSVLARHERVLSSDFSQMKKPSPREVECTIPVLPVKNLARSIRFYTVKLGFKLDWRGSVVCSVSRDGRPIMLRQRGRREKTAPVWVWIGLRGDRLFERFKAKRVKVLQRPQNHAWAYDMMFADPDGNVLWMGTETKRDRPLDD